MRRKQNVSFNLKNTFAANIIEIPCVTVLPYDCLHTRQSEFLGKVVFGDN